MTSKDSDLNYGLCIAGLLLLLAAVLVPRISSDDARQPQVEAQLPTAATQNLELVPTVAPDKTPVQAELFDIDELLLPVVEPLSPSDCSEQRLQGLTATIAGERQWQDVTDWSPTQAKALEYAEFAVNDRLRECRVAGMLFTPDATLCLELIQQVNFLASKGLSLYPPTAEQIATGLSEDELEGLALSEKYSMCISAGYGGE